MSTNKKLSENVYKKKKWLFLILFLVGTFVYSAVVNCKQYGYDTPVKGKVIYYSIMVWYCWKLLTMWFLKKLVLPV